MIDTKRIEQMLKREIARANKPENLANYQQFFKEKLDEPVGLRGPVLRAISNLIYREVKAEGPVEILQMCDRLLETDLRCRRFFAFEWAAKQKDHFRPSEFARFEKWLKKYVDYWGACDSLCAGPLGILIAQYPELAEKMRPWQKSKNRWLRRGAAVGLIVPVKQRQLLDEVFRTADVLLQDTDDIVQKGYGWMLKEASNRFPEEVFAYVMKHKARMPRTALRYAIEKLPPARRKQAMAK
ncbi:MAG: DNA alkylation repair protein [Candidatus Zixiibacteriota bacterium]